MKTIIAGCRDIPQQQAWWLVSRAIAASGWKDEITEVIHGAASGVDSAAHEICDGIWPVTAMPADWKTHGRAAGPIRNRAMAEIADALIAVWDGKSRGTKNMIETARELGLRVFVFRIDERGGREPGAH